ncbi:MAG: DDE-type integrase/transposase/recombinase [Herpetosiphonaceae bacterium]|nr:DDE-type integrase/transposase/recombinase [Herpetosiphonaceae bacterium]
MAAVVLTDLTEDERTTALTRFHVLQPALEHGVPLSTVAQTHQIPVRTLWRWVARYRATGLVGLARKPRSDHGHHRVPDHLQTIIEGLALQKPRPSIAGIHRQLTEVASQQGWPMPSYGTVYTIVQQLDPGMITLAHEGERAYEETFDLLYRREVTRPNESWQADHTPLDIWLITPQGNPARPWLTIILDEYSRSVAGYFLSFTAPSALHTALALHQAIWRKSDPRWPICGIPERFYTDHGSDFTSLHMEQVSADLKMQLVFSHPGHPRGRGKIERFFKTINQLFLANQPGYTPAGSPPCPPALTLPQFEARFLEFVVETYHQRRHSEHKHAPVLRWATHAFVPQMPDSLEQLDLLLLTVAKARKVHQDGIHFHGFRYLDPTLAAYVGESVIIRYDPRDMAEIRIYHDQMFVCRAICQELANHQVSLKEIITARTAQRRAIRHGITDRSAIIKTYLSAHSVETTTDTSSTDPVPSTQPHDPPRLKRYEHE